MITDWWPVLAVLAVVMLGKVFKAGVKLIIGGVLLIGGLYLLTQFL